MDTEFLRHVFRRCNFVCVSLWGDQFGGGEAFLFETCKWALRNGAKNVAWISFENADIHAGAKTHAPYKSYCIRSIFSAETNRTTTGSRDVYAVQIPGGFSSEALRHWLCILEPDIVHHQGHKRLEIMECCCCYEKILKKQCIFITGFHFWMDIVRLDGTTFNVEIERNSARHAIDPNFDIVSQTQNANCYVVSEFMDNAVRAISSNEQEIKKRTFPRVCYPFISEASAAVKTFSIESVRRGERPYVTFMNLHKLKGGIVFLNLLKKTDLPCQGVFSEFFSDDLDAQIVDEVRQRKNITLLIKRQESVAEIYDQTRILVIASVVDETFCRVAQEAIVRGIPIVTSGAGNLSYFFCGDGAGGVVVPSCYAELNKKCCFEDIASSRDTSFVCSDEMIHEIDALYRDEARLERMSQQSIRYHAECLTRPDRTFEGVVLGAIERSLLLLPEKKRRSVMFVTPWGDQGLGIQSRFYVKEVIEDFKRANSLGDDDVCCHIFAFASYFRNSDRVCNQNVQADADEWRFDNNSGSEIYFSSNDREHITDEELDAFVAKHKITHCVIPEICFFRVFEIAQHLKTAHAVTTIAIPNVEIVRHDELRRYDVFDRILCNNAVCYEKLAHLYAEKLRLVRFALRKKKEEATDNNVIKKKRIRFLLLGGFNTVSRKQADVVCSAFARLNDGYRASKKEINFELTVTSLVNIDTLVQTYRRHSSNIFFITKHLSYHKEIDALYANADVVIQVSKHEGLGLGFYESISRGIPVVTLDTAPHNEIIKDGENGWILKNVRFEPMKDNPKGIVKSCLFRAEDLAALLEERVLSRPEEYIRNDMRRRTLALYDDSNSYEAFVRTFCDALLF